MSRPAWLGLLRGARLQTVRSLDVGHLQLGWYLPHEAARAAGTPRVWLELAANATGQLASLGLDKLPQRDRPTGFAMAVRRDGVGARLQSVGVEEAALRLVLERGPERWTLLVAGRGHAAQLSLWRDGELHVASGGAAAPTPRLVDVESVADFADATADRTAMWRAAFVDGERARAAFLRAAAEAQLVELRRALWQHRKRVARRLRRIEADAARADEAPALRLDAEVLKTALHAVPRGASEVVLPAPWLPEGERRISLRPDEDARDAVDRLFRRARGLEAGAEQIAQRWTQTEEELAAVDTLRARLDGVTPPDGDAQLGPWREALAALRGEVRALGALRRGRGRATQRSTKGRHAGRSRPLPSGVDAFVAASGAQVFVGRSATANDALLRSLARGRDLWMHVRDRPGAHLVLRVRGREPAEREDVREAAQLVAHRSGVGPGEHAEVIIAEVRQVRRIAGARPGQVTIGQHRVVPVRVDKALVDAIYARRDD